jgi:signal peptidase II
MTLTASLRWPLIALCILAADQLSKWAVNHFTSEGYFRELIPRVLNFVHVRNRGVAFSLFSDFDSPLLRPALIAFTLVAVAFLIWVLATRRAGHVRVEAGLALILGGAVGNLIDRILRGSVVDFVDLHWGEYHWPAFNVADSAITIGAILVIWDLLFGAKSSQA